MILTPTRTVLYSATDLAAAAHCEWALMRALDAKLGRIPKPPVDEDDMLRRTAALGDRHELEELERLRENHGHENVKEFERPDFGKYEEAAAETIEALEQGSPVVFQGVLFDGRFLGFSDFIIRNADGRYEVHDTKLARSAKITALLQLAAYSDLLAQAGIPLGDEVHVILGTGERSSHRLRDILPVYRARRARLQHIIDERVAEPEAETQPETATANTGTRSLHPVTPVPGTPENPANEHPAATPWGDSRYTACGRCPACAEQVEAHRDVLLVAGMKTSQRMRLNAAGVATIEQLATRTARVPGLAEATLAALRRQASIQLQPKTDEQPVPWRLADGQVLTRLPAPSPGDVFFDFEGDPLYHEGEHWGLDYLFGLVEADGTFRPFWAHDLEGEKRALVEFLAYLAERRREHPDLHVYHYAAYERSHLLSLAARHGVGEEQVDELLRAGTLIDLYPIVRQGFDIGSRSYSLKKLEPLYMGEAQRAGVANAADSITEYGRYRALREASAGPDGNPAAGDPAAVAEAETVLADIARYNEYDCLSTLRLRDWLLERRTEAGIPAPDAPLPGLEVQAPEPHPVYLALAARVADVPLAERTADDTALALAAAAIDYHRREAKSFWWEHYSRLAEPIEEWADTRDVLVVDRAEVVRDWEKVGRARTLSRELQLSGTLAPGSRLGEGGGPFIAYDRPVPPLAGREAQEGMRAAHDRVEITAVSPDGQTVRLTEKLRQGEDPYDNLPVALTPAKPPAAGTVAEAIAEWGEQLLDALPDGPRPASSATPGTLVGPSAANLGDERAGAEERAVADEPAAADLPADPALDILRRRAPRIRSLPRSGDAIADITAALLALDRSYLAVQGPPGTGKTYTGSHVIAELVQRHGWRIGVVGQSHATVENMLAGVIKAGVDPAVVGKRPAKKDTPVEGVPWTQLTIENMPEFTRRPGGLVVGGTQWQLTSATAIERASLDLLVIDEAGQFSLANTIACSVAAQRLLLLGDPQQLPQVSQGSHPEPVDRAALAWLSDGHDVLPAEFGYFLDTSWRMHPAVCAPVSQLSYEGRLTSHPSVRRLAGVEPGLTAQPIPHRGNATSSPEEADAVVQRIQSLLGREWTSAHGDGPPTTRPLGEDDVIVVAPYNAQVELIRRRLADARLPRVRVGTVDKFQGQEAAIAIVSLAASSAAEVPRGLDFLLMANRLNVAISRAQWAAYLVYSPGLTEHLPTSAEGLAQLSAFLRLVGGGVNPRKDAGEGCATRPTAP